MFGMLLRVMDQSNQYTALSAEVILVIIDKL